MRIFSCFLLFLFMVASVFAPAVQSATTTVAEDGVLDLRHMPLQTYGPVDLRGHWQFYWQAFLNPDELAGHEALKIKTPATWGSQSQLLNIDDQGYGTYYLQILLSDRDVGKALAIDLPSIASAYDLYINGEKLASAGNIGTSLERMKPSALPQPLYVHAASNSLELVVHVSNFSQRKGGIWDRLRLGTADQISNEREQRMLFQAFIASGLLLIGIYHIGYYFFRLERTTLYFGLASLSQFLRNMFVGDHLAARVFPGIPWEIAVKIEYASVFFGISFLVLYFFHLYENNLRRGPSYGLVVLMMGITLPVFVLPARIYTEWMLAYQLVLLALVLYIVYGLVRAAFYRYIGAGMNLFVGLIFLATVLNDILYYNFLLETIDLVTLGLFLFLFTQMFMLASKFSAAFREVEQLKAALVGVNENLEATIQKRTAELQGSNEKLIRAEQARKDLLSNVSHELGNPLTSIIGYLKRVKDGAAKDAVQRHVEIAYQKALRLERLTNDLRQMLKLEHDQFTYQKKLVGISSLQEELENSYDWELLDRQVQVAFDKRNFENFGVYVDLNRMEQVFVNFVNNALTHTKTGDKITIIGRLFPFAGAYAVKVQDTGCGILPEERDRIFDRFYRAKHSGIEQYEGTGLGLSISKTIIEAHHGKIGVRSGWGKGSTFYFILPLARRGEYG